MSEKLEAFDYMIASRLVQRPYVLSVDAEGAPVVKTLDEWKALFDPYRDGRKRPVAELEQARADYHKTVKGLEKGRFKNYKLINLYEVRPQKVKLEVLKNPKKLSDEKVSGSIWDGFRFTTQAQVTIPFGFGSTVRAVVALACDKYSWHYKVGKAGEPRREAYSDVPAMKLNVEDKNKNIIYDASRHMRDMFHIEKVAQLRQEQKLARQKERDKANLGRKLARELEKMPAPKPSGI